MPTRTVLDEDCLEGSDEEAFQPRGLSELDAMASVPAAAYEPGAFELDDELQETLEQILADEDDRYAFFVRELRTGRAASSDADDVFHAASLYKLLVMYEIFRQQAAGLLEWDDRLLITPYYDDYGLSPRSTQVCQILTVAQAMDAMLRVSDNAASVLLLDLAGASNVNRSVMALGLSSSGIFTDGLPITAEDSALLMEAIAMGEAISPQASADMLRLMSADVFDNGLVSGVPDEAVVVHKTGNLSNATHEAGIVYGPGSVFVFVVLSETSHETAVIRSLATAAYEHFEGK